MSHDNDRPNVSSQRGLIPQPDKSLAPVRAESLPRLKGRWAMIVTGLGAVSGWFSTTLHWGTWILDQLQRADFLNTKFLELLRWFFSPDGAHALTGLFLAAFLVAVYRTIYPKERLDRSVGQQENEEQIPVEDAEQLRGRIAELEREKTVVDKDKSVLKERIETLNAQHRSELERLQRQTETQSIQISVRDGELETLKTKYGWLHEVAGEDAQDIGKRVFVTPGEVRYNLSSDLPQIDFDFIAFNGSVYSLSIDPTPEGEITCGKKPFIEAKRVNGFKNLAHGYQGTFTLELRLSPTEAARILKKQQSGEDVFYFGHLTIKVNGGDYYPNLTAKPLKLPDRVRETAITEREKFLKTQYESEIGEQQQRAGVIEKLTYVLGMTQQVSAQFSLGGPVNNLALVTLNNAIGTALWTCFKDQQFVVDDYYGGAPHNIPDSTDEQKKWVELHYHKLSKLIDEQRPGK